MRRRRASSILAANPDAAPKEPWTAGLIRDDDSWIRTENVAPLPEEAGNE